MRTAAKFDRIVFAIAVGTQRGIIDTHRQYAHFVAVFFTEQRQRARFNRFIRRHQTRRDITVLTDHTVDDAFDFRNFFRRHGLGVAEVETQTFRRHHRTLLRHVVAEHTTQRLVQQMCCRVIGPRRCTARAIHLHFNNIAELQATAIERAEMHDHIAELFLRVADGEFRARAAEQQARVADLTTGLAIERRLVGDDRSILTCRHGVNRRTVNNDANDFTFGGFILVAEEFTRTERFAQLEPNGFSRLLARTRPRGARVFALLLHRLVETGLLHLNTLGAQRVLR